MSAKRKQAKRPKRQSVQQMVDSLVTASVVALVRRVEALEREMAAQLAIRDAMTRTYYDRRHPLPPVER